MFHFFFTLIYHKKLKIKQRKKKKVVFIDSTSQTDTHIKNCFNIINLIMTPKKFS
jgi:hypothetical protein